MAAHLDRDQVGALTLLTLFCMPLVLMYLTSSSNRALQLHSTKIVREVILVFSGLFMFRVFYRLVTVLAIAFGIPTESEDPRSHREHKSWQFLALDAFFFLAIWGLSYCYMRRKADHAKCGKSKKDSSDSNTMSEKAKAALEIELDFVGTVSGLLMGAFFAKLTDKMQEYFLGEGGAAMWSFLGAMLVLFTLEAIKRSGLVPLGCGCLTRKKEDTEHPADKVFEEVWEDTRLGAAGAYFSTILVTILRARVFGKFHDIYDATEDWEHETYENNPSFVYAQVGTMFLIVGALVLLVWTSVAIESRFNLAKGSKISRVLALLNLTLWFSSAQAMFVALQWVTRAVLPFTFTTEHGEKDSLNGMIVHVWAAMVGMVCGVVAIVILILSKEAVVRARKKVARGAKVDDTKSDEDATALLLRRDSDGPEPVTVVHMDEKGDDTDESGKSAPESRDSNLKLPTNTRAEGSSNGKSCFLVLLEQLLMGHVLQISFLIGEGWDSTFHGAISLLCRDLDFSPVVKSSVETGLGLVFLAVSAPLLRYYLMPRVAMLEKRAEAEELEE